MSWKLEHSLALQFYNETVHEDPYLIKDGLLLLILCASKNYQKHYFMLIKH
jgi:hypothetical protein